MTNKLICHEEPDTSTLINSVQSTAIKDARSSIYCFSVPPVYANGTVAALASIPSHMLWGILQCECQYKKWQKLVLKIQDRQKRILDSCLVRKSPLNGVCE